MSEPPLIRRLRATLREWMVMRGISQTELAKRLGIKQATVSRILVGRRQLDDLALLASIAGALHGTLPELLGIDEGLPPRERALLTAWRALGERERQLLEQWLVILSERQPRVMSGRPVECSEIDDRMAAMIQMDTETD